MMNHKNYGYVPPLDTQAGSCLTALNWQEVAITAISYSLQALLIKPGFSVLKQVKNLADFFSWSGEMVLDARMPPANREGIYRLQSPYDGSKMSINAQELISIINHLAPDYVLLPSSIQALYPQIWQDLSESIFPLLSRSDFDDSKASTACGLYCDFDETKEQDNSAPRIIIGSQSQLADKTPHANQNIIAWLSNQPLIDAYQGQLYTKDQTIDLTQEGMAEQFELIDRQCCCPVCQQGFTRAYLHHLFAHTPLLCHRFLIQHNVYYIQHQIT